MMCTVCMGKYKRERLSEMKVNGRVTYTWKESVDVLMEQFFPAARMNVVTSATGNADTSEKSFEWNEV